MSDEQYIFYNEDEKNNTDDEIFEFKKFGDSFDNEETKIELFKYNISNKLKTKLFDLIDENKKSSVTSEQINNMINMIENFANLFLHEICIFFNSYFEISNSFEIYEFYLNNEFKKLFTTKLINGSSFDDKCKLLLDCRKYNALYFSSQIATLIVEDIYKYSKNNNNVQNILTIRIKNNLLI